jgi:GNAT superfamily N-acetyltransferase
MTTRAITTDVHPAGRVEFRDTVRGTDVQAVRSIVASSGFFAPHEIDIAVELVEERLARGVASGYHFVFADMDGCPIGYACYGPIGCTVGSFDLYWIAVQAASRGHGLGRRLLREVERRVTLAGGRRLYIETSSRTQYEPTRRFYERCGYKAEARLDDFYSPGDAKVIYVKPVNVTSIRDDCCDRDVEQPAKSGGDRPAS